MTAARFARYQFPIFVALAFAITWSAQVPAYLHADRHGFTLTNEANTLHVRDLFLGDLDAGLLPYLLVSMFAFGPTVAGIVVTAAFQGRAGLADLWARTARVRVAPRWVLVALVLPLLLSGASVALAFVLGGMQPLRWSFLVPLALSPALLVYMLVFTGLAEEVGWRGYALPELQRHHTAERASWILGVTWGLWHLPSVLLAPYLRGEMTVPRAVAVLLGLTVGVVGWTIVLTWIYNNTRSVFWIIIVHGWSNTVTSYLVLSSSSYLAQVLGGVLPWVVALYLLRHFDAETLTRRRLEPAGETATSW